MAHLEEHTTIDSLLSLTDINLQSISIQREKKIDNDNNLFVLFDITYNGHKGYITIHNNPFRDYYGEITLDLSFPRPAGVYNYPKLHKLAQRFIKFMNY